MKLLEVDGIAAVPIHWKRELQRGFNQSVILCEALPRELIRHDLIRRIRWTKPQVELKQEERLTNLVGAFEAKGEVAGLRILLIDDVYTSGGTALSCATALKKAGAKEVGILTLTTGGLAISAASAPRRLFARRSSDERSPSH